MNKKILLSGVVASVLFLGCGSSSTSSTTNNNVSGTVVDGPIYNAEVCVDYNFNGICDSGEPKTYTDVNGNYTLNDVNLSSTAPVIVIPQPNTVDTATNTLFTKKLSAPLSGNDVNVNPVTTLVGAYMYKLKQEGNLTKDSVDQVKESVAKAFGIDNPDELTTMDIRKDPKVYAKAVAIAQVLDNNLSDIDKKIDFNKLNEGNLTDAVSDTNISSALQILNSANIDIDNPDVIQDIIEKSIKENNTSLLSDPAQWTAVSIENVLVNNVFYKNSDNGLSITFDSNGSFVDYSEEDGTVTKETGTWSVNNDGTVTLSYSNGASVTLTKMVKENAYVYDVSGNDSDGSFTDRAIAVPKNITDYSQLPGITPVSELDFTGRSVEVSDNDYFTFDSNGTCIESREENGNIETYNYSWKVSNGVLEITGTAANNTPFSIDAVRFDDSMFVFYTENNITKAFVLPYKFVSLPDNFAQYEPTVSEPVNSISFSVDMISGKTIAYSNYMIVFKDDGTWTRYEYNNGSVISDGSGKWYIDEADGNLVLNDTQDNVNLVFSLIENKYPVMEIYNPSYGYVWVDSLNTTDPYNVDINSSSDLSKVVDVDNFQQFDANMISGDTFKDVGGDIITFDSNGTFNITGAHDFSGNWSVDSDGILVLNFTNNPDIDTKYVLLGYQDNNEYKVLTFGVKNGKLVESFPNVLTQDTVTYPLLTSIGQIWNYDWYKMLYAYSGDTRYIDNKVMTGDEYIGLAAYKKDGQDSRAQVGTEIDAAGFNADINMIDDGEYSKFQTGVVVKNINTSSIPKGLSTDSGLTFVAGFSLRNNRITAWWEFDDPEGHELDGDVASNTYDYNLTGISDKNDLQVQINANNGVIEYKAVRLDTNETIFDANLSVNDLNITNFNNEFKYVYFRSRVDARDTNNTLGDSLNYVNDFSVINTAAVSSVNNLDDFLNQLGFTPQSIDNTTFDNKTVYIRLYGDSGNIYFDSNGTYVKDGEDKGSWETDSNTLELNNGNTTYIAVENNNNGLLNIKGYDGYNNVWFTDTVLVGNGDVNTTIANTTDLYNYFSSLSPVDINDTEVEGTWKTLNSDENDTQTYNSDGTFSASWDEDGNTTTITGNWSIDSNTVVVTLDSNSLGWSKIYVVPLSYDENTSTLTEVTVIVDANNNIKLVSASNSQKQ